jgi:hypothetical protein
MASIAPTTEHFLNSDSAAAAAALGEAHASYAKTSDSVSDSGSESSYDLPKARPADYDGSLKTPAPFNHEESFAKITSLNAYHEHALLALVAIYKHYRKFKAIF